MSASLLRHAGAVVTTQWLRILLGLLGGCELLMAVGAAPPTTVLAGLAAGVALVTAAVVSRPGRRTVTLLVIVLSLPFATLTWWTIVTPVVTLTALAIALAVTTGSGRVVAVLPYPRRAT